MKGNAGECQGNIRVWMQSAWGTQGNSREYRGMPGECMEMGAKCQGNAGECRGMPGERMGVRVNCQGKAGNAGECQVNVWEWVFSARGIQGTTRGMGVGVKC